MADADLRAWVRDYLGRLLKMPPAQIRMDCGFSAYGLDSVEAIRMAGALEEVIGVALDPTIMLRYPTLEQIIAAIERLPAAQQPG